MGTSRTFSNADYFPAVLMETVGLVPLHLFTKNTFECRRLSCHSGKRGMGSCRVNLARHLRFFDHVCPVPSATMINSRTVKVKQRRDCILLPSVVGEPFGVENNSESNSVKFNLAQLVADRCHSAHIHCEQYRWDLYPG